MCICHIHNGHLCIYTDFLSKFVEEIIVDRAFSGHQGIDEDEVETMPETLIPYRNILLDDKLQKEAKKYFTDDGWLAAQNTIDILKNLQTSGKLPSCTIYCKTLFISEDFIFA